MVDIRRLVSKFALAIVLMGCAGGAFAAEPYLHYKFEGDLKNSGSAGSAGDLLDNGGTQYVNCRNGDLLNKGLSPTFQEKRGNFRFTEVSSFYE